MEGFRICEINARFCWNGYMHGGFGQESLSAFNLESRGLVHAAEAESVRLETEAHSASVFGAKDLKMGRLSADC